MGKISLSAGQLFSSITFFRPNRPVLVTTCDRDGTAHVAPFAWCVPTSALPPMVTLALLSTPRKQHSLVNIERDGEFVVNLPGYDLSADLVRASYRYPAGVRKIGILGLEFEPSQCIRVPAIKQCRAQVECRLKTSMVTGDHTLLVAEVVAASYVPEQYQDGFILDTEAYPPCLHLGHRPHQGGQAHTFMVAGGVETLDLPFNLSRHVADISVSSGATDLGDGSENGKDGWWAKATQFANGFACPEGPCCHKGESDLFVVDWAMGVIRRVTPEGKVLDFVDTGGMPAGACFDPTGNLYVCDPGRKAVLDITPDGAMRVAADNYEGKALLGPNDCTCDPGGNLYFSDADGLRPLEPSGSVYLLRPDGRLELFAEGFVYPNGLSVSPDGRFLYLAETFANRIHRFQLDERGQAQKQQVFANLEGGLGPDGLAMDATGNLYVAHFGKGVVTVLAPTGQMLAELPTEGFLPTNVTFWNGSLYVTELERGCIMRLDRERGEG